MKVDLDKLLETVVETRGSDLHIAVGRPPVIRLHGRLRSLNLPNLTPEDTIELVRSFAPRENLDEMEQVGTSDFAIPFRDKARFRCSIFKERGYYGAALRLIPNQLLNLKAIGLPDAVINLLLRPRGLILVTGPTGSGKTTTLASMIDYLNENYDKHIITIEDPIEYHHPHKKSVVMQREIGRDVSGFSEALRRALRQDPDVVLMGEMRDTETIATAITAAETGHLVFGTLHTTGAARTVDRIIDSFPHEQQEQIRTQLSVSIVAVISQVLMPKADGKGRVAAFEILINTSAVENHIRKKETFKIPSVIQTSKKLGMQRLDDHLAELVAAGQITREVAYEYSLSAADLAIKLGEPAPGQGT
ncbi:MAG: type IV pilus twitching motility protein PilT [Planctomycetes bacterium]|nr:type IV pilus twitching motility protein PilT [Planctomycetota bacterium]